nr:MAG TPA: hypothetical protein [Caudoviricetes sp.]
MAKEIKNPDLVGEIVEKATGEELAKSKKVRIRLPKDQLNEEDVVVPVCINGYTYQIKRGEWVDVPEEVARILEEAGYMG